MKLDSLSHLHIMVGPNNAGKTNILDALETLFLNKETDKDTLIELSLTYKGEKIKSLASEGEIKNELPEKVREKFVRISKNPPFKEIAQKELKEFEEKYKENHQRFISTLDQYFDQENLSKDLFLSSAGEEDKLRRMGDGFKRLFVILFYVYHPDYQIILIDEPELHLHPSAIKKFLRIIEEEPHQNQIFLTTHHPTLVQAKLLNHTWRVMRNEKGSTSVYRLEDVPDLSIERFIQEINDDNSSMLFSDKILLVEGVSDSILMRGLINRFSKKEKDIKVVYTGGKGDINLYTKLCKIFNIPYLAMLDRDALDQYPELEDCQSEKEKIEILKEKCVFILEKSLERTYPRKYQKKDTKPLNALLAANSITKEEYYSKEMSPIREVIESL